VDFARLVFSSSFFSAHVFLKCLNYESLSKFVFFKSKLPRHQKLFQKVFEISRGNWFLNGIYPKTKFVLAYGAVFHGEVLLVLDSDCIGHDLIGIIYIVCGIYTWNKN
jgi:hypothetical protein